MFGLESGTRYFMCQHPVSMRKGIDSLFNLVVSESPMSPMTGDVFVFFSKNRQSVKLLRWDTDGFFFIRSVWKEGLSRCPARTPTRAITSSRGRRSAS